MIAEYSDDGVKGGDPVDQRPGFAAMLKHIASNGVRTIIVETATLDMPLPREIASHGARLQR